MSAASGEDDGESDYENNPKFKPQRLYLRTQSCMQKTVTPMLNKSALSTLSKEKQDAITAEVREGVREKLRDIVDTLAPRETYDYKPLARAVILAVFAKNIASFNHEDADGNRMGDSSPEELLDISDN